MMGTFGGSLEARQIDASNGKLTAEVIGEVEAEEGVLVIRLIHVAMRLVAPKEAKEIVERTHGIYAMSCPLYRTLHNAIEAPASFRQVIEAGSVKTLALPPRSPNLNAYAERWVRSVREECLAKLILLGEGSLRRALRHYEAHYHEERNHQGKNNVLLFPLPTQAVRGEQEKVRCRERLGGLLKYYEREAA